MSCGERWTNTALNSTCCCKSVATRPQQSGFSDGCCAVTCPVQDRHRSTARLSGRKGRGARTGGREARIREGSHTAEQPGGNSRQPTRRRERQMQGFRDSKRTQAFLSRFGPIHQHFALPRHQMTATCHREQLKARFQSWYGWASVQLVDANQ